MKKLITLFLILTATFSLFSCQKNGETNNTTTGEKEETSTAVAFVTIDINPSIEITLDENGVVASVYGANEDGQILLYGEMDALVGKQYEEAVDYITNLAVELGYLDKETGTINTSVIADSVAFAEEVQSKISGKIKSISEQNGITIDIDTTEAFSLLCEFEEFKNKYPNEETIQNISLTEFKLALTLSEREGISVKAALEYDSEELISKINVAHNKLETFATDAYLAAKKEANRIFDKAMGIAVAGVYNEIYLKNPVSHIGTFYYGALYQAYYTTSLTYRSVYEIKEFAESVSSIELDERIIENVKTTLNLEDVSVLKDEEGKITVASLMAFCDEFISKNNVSEEAKDLLQGYIFEAKAAMELANKATTSMYSADMSALKSQIEIVISTMDTTYNTVKLLMTEKQKSEIEDCLADLAMVNTKISEIIDGGITLTEIDVLATTAEEKAAQMLEKIKADLSEAELQQVEARITELKNLQSQLITDFENRLAVAEAEAKKYIEEVKQARKETSKVK